MSVIIVGPVEPVMWTQGGTWGQRDWDSILIAGRTLEIGQVWHDDDPRSVRYRSTPEGREDRYVLIVGLTDTHAQVKTWYQAEPWRPSSPIPPAHRRTEIPREHFLPIQPIRYTYMGDTAARRL